MVAVRIRHHTIPMSHTYNCLHGADFIGRYENLAEDFTIVADRLGITDPLPKLNTIKRGD
jgi:hypothetical protein